MGVGAATSCHSRVFQLEQTSGAAAAEGAVAASDWTCPLGGLLATAVTSRHSSINTVCVCVGWWGVTTGNHCQQQDNVMLNTQKLSVSLLALR